MSLNLNNYRSVAQDLPAGETMRVNHDDCPAGVDTKRRLYLTRVQADATKVIGYCHNCAQGGMFTDGKYEPYRDATHTQAQLILDVYDDAITLPDNLVYSITEWPSYAQAWAYKNKLVQHDLSTYMISYDPSTDRICLPRYARVTSSGQIDLEGYQLRHLRGGGPKYLTAQATDSKGYSRIGDLDSSPPVVIVEDLVSGIRVARSIDAVVLVNYGVKINPLLIPEASKHPNVIVWLDNDSTFVKNQAKIYARTIGLYNESSSISVIEDQLDPKYLPDEEIYEVVEDTYYGSH